MLRTATPISWEGTDLTVELASPVKAVLEHRRDEIEKLLRSIALRKVRLLIQEPESAGETTETDLPPDAKTLAEEDELVKHAMDLFNGRVKRAHLKKKP